MGMKWKILLGSQTHQQDQPGHLDSYHQALEPDKLEIQTISVNVISNIS